MLPRATQLLCKIGTQQIALDAADVIRVTQAVAIIPLPGAPAKVLGSICVHGHLVPVISPHYILGIPQPPLHPSHVFVFVQTSNGTVALSVDAIVDLTMLDEPVEDSVSPTVSLPAHVLGIAQGPDGLVLLEDIEAFLTSEECEQLESALENAWDTHDQHRLP